MTALIQPMKSGVREDLEGVADVLLSARTRWSGEYQVLSIDQIERRRRREIHNESGFADGALMYGQFRRRVSTIKYLNSVRHGRRRTCSEEWTCLSHYEKFGTMMSNARFAPAWLEGMTWDDQSADDGERFVIWTFRGDAQIEHFLRGRDR